jgi:hypothetical protein
MVLYLHKSLCDLSKAGELASSADPESTAGEQRGGDYFHRIQTGYKKDNTPKYRYFKTKDEWDGYVKGKGATGKERTKKTGDESAQRLKEKTTKEQEESSAKQKDSLFIKQKDKKIKKSLYINLEAK